MWTSSRAKSCVLILGIRSLLLRSLGQRTMTRENKHDQLNQFNPMFTQSSLHHFLDLLSRNRPPLYRIHHLTRKSRFTIVIRFIHPLTGPQFHNIFQVRSTTILTRTHHTSKRSHFDRPPSGMVKKLMPDHDLLRLLACILSLPHHHRYVPVIAFRLCVVNLYLPDQRFLNLDQLGPPWTYCLSTGDHSILLY